MAVVAVVQIARKHLGIVIDGAGEAAAIGGAGDRFGTPINFQEKDAIAVLILQAKELVRYRAPPGKRDAQRCFVDR